MTLCCPSSLHSMPMSSSPPSPSSLLASSSHAVEEETQAADDDCWIQPEDLQQLEALTARLSAGGCDEGDEDAGTEDAEECGRVLLYPKDACREAEKEVDDYMREDADKLDAFDWASVAALAIVGRAAALSPISTADSSTPPPSSLSPSPSPRRSPTYEDKVEQQHSPQPSAAPASIASSVPSSFSPLSSPALSPALSSASACPPFARVSSPLPLAARIHALCSLIIELASSAAQTQELLESVTALRHLLSSRSSQPFTLTLSTPILPSFCALLRHPQSSPQLLLEVAWCLTNLASGSSAHVQQLVDAGVVGELMARLRPHEHEQVLEQVVWCLGNIAGDNAEHRDRLLQAGLMPRLCSLTEQRIGPELLKHITWCLHNLCRNKPCPSPSRVSHCIPTIRRLLMGGELVAPAVAAASTQLDSETLPDLLWVLSCLSECSDGVRSRLLHEGFLSFLMALLSSRVAALSLVLLTPAIRTVGNFLTGSEAETQLVLDSGFVPVLSQLLRFPEQQVVKEACWAASNVAAGSVEQKQALFDQHGLLSAVTEAAVSSSLSTRKEATWVLCNLCEGGTDSQLDGLVALGVVRTLTASLLHPSQHIYPVAAAGLQCLLRRGDKYKDGEECQQAAARLRVEMLRVLTEGHAGRLELLSSVGDDELGPVLYSPAVESRWQSLVERLDESEQERLLTLRNVLSMIRYRDEQEDDSSRGGSSFSQGEERWKEEDDEDEETARPSSALYCSSVAATAGGSAAG